MVFKRVLHAPIFSCLILFFSSAWAESSSIELLVAKTTQLEKEIKALKEEMATLQSSQTSESPAPKTMLSTMTSVVGLPVINSVYLNKQPEFDGSDLIVNMSENGLYLNLMEQRATIAPLNSDNHYPIVMLSGEVQPVMVYQQSSQSSTARMAIYSAIFDISTIINPWVESFFSFMSGASSYSSLANADDLSMPSNLSITVDNAFINIGNLNKTPFYLVAGQAYLPFGQYNTNMVTWSMLSAMAQTRQPTVIAGYSQGVQNGFSGALFAYNSEVTQGNNGAGGGNLTYQWGNDAISGNLSGSVISNIGDSGGMQNTGASDGTFPGFGENANTEAFNPVPGYDFNGTLNIGSYSFLAEYASAAVPFSSSALSYNGEGAKPSSGNIEAAQTFKWLHKPATVAIGYGWTSQALALDLAQQRFSAVLNVSWWRDTVESLEFRHDINYSSSDYASGLGAEISNTGANTSTNTLTGSIALYF